MTLKIRNSWHYNGCLEGYNYWEWKAFLDDGDSGELFLVNYVEYVLPPTFLYPIRKIIDPRGGFIVNDFAYGSFELRANVLLKDGRLITLTHDMLLICDPIDGISDTKTIYSGTFIIRPGMDYYIQFEILDQEMLSFHFNAQGGIGDDIEVLVIDEYQYNYWRSLYTQLGLRQIPARYYSGKITISHISMHLPRGRYRLIYSNRFSIIASKRVTTKIDIIY